jgi:hypothetical protein
MFGYFLYQFHNMVNCAAIYITVVLALERYRAVWRPIEYHNNINGVNPWRRVFNYIVPVIVIVVLFNLPKFFEVRFKAVNESESVYDEQGEFVTVSGLNCT